MRITHSHSTDNTDYSIGIANAEFNIELSDGIQLPLKAIDIKTLQQSGLNLPINVDEWLIIARRNIESNRDLRVFHLIREAFERDMNNGIYYDQDYLRFSMMGLGKQIQQDVDLFHNKILGNYIEAIYSLQSSLYYLNPTELESINTVQSKWIIKDDGLHYENELLNIKLNNKLKEDLFFELRKYFEKYYESTIDCIKYNLEQAQDRPTLDFILTTGAYLIREFSDKKKVTIKDLRSLITSFFGEYSVDDTFD